MFTISWVNSKKVVIPEGAVQHDNGYWYTDSTYGQYLSGNGFRNGLLGTGVTYRGTGETIEKATAALRSNIEAGLSKNRDKPVLEALKDFDKATK